MKLRHQIPLLASTLLVAACGGGGGAPAFLPAPPPAPPPPSQPLSPPGGHHQIIAEATTSQDFTAHSPYGPSAAEGMQVSYDAATGNYHVSIPWVAQAALVPDGTPPAGQPPQNFKAGDAYVFTHGTAENENPDRRYRYSNLATWTAPAGPNEFLVGTTAFGIATAAEAMPRSGSANYNGFLSGFSSEKFDDGWGSRVNAWIDGTIQLSFDFAAASLSGSLNPRLLTYETYDLGTFAVSQPVWAVGSPSFSASLPGQYPGGARLSGTFTGPSAQELIGSFSFGYTSPIDGSQQGAGGAYLAKPPQ